MELKNEHRSAIEKIKNFIDEGEFYFAGEQLFIIILNIENQ